MSKQNLPFLDNRVVCVVSDDKPELASLISSYFARRGYYFPLYIFPKVKTLAEEKHDHSSDGYLSSMIGGEASVLIGNSIAKMSGYGKIIYAGLSNEQVSYLQRRGLTNDVITVSDVNDAQEKLKGFVSSSVMDCDPSNFLRGLINAGQKGIPLNYVNGRDEVVKEKMSSKNLVVIEEDEANPVSVVVAINYAIAMGAEIELVQPVSKSYRNKYELLLNKWHSSGDLAFYNEVIKEIENRISHIDFSQYEDATFFTRGLPYSLGVKIAIPVGHVHLALRPDLFICNSLGVEAGDRNSSALIFSPQFFVNTPSGEETELVEQTFSGLNYYVKMILGEDATSGALDFYAHHFPYDLLHICSHGGSADGYSVTFDFTDRNGNDHVLEYDELVSFSPVTGEETIEVTTKNIFRKFDGFEWQSDELSKQNIKNEVYEDMRKMMSLSNPDQSNTHRKPKESIEDTSVIYCYRGFHQGAFRSLSSHNSSIIFNNSCSSWGEVSNFFLSSGSRGYIGTLWSVGLNVAVDFSKSFYQKLPTTTISEAVAYANSKISDKKYKNIYLYWGLPFTTLSKEAVTVEESYKNVFSTLVTSLKSWKTHAEEDKISEVQKNSERVVLSILRELLTNFNLEDVVASGKISYTGSLSNVKAGVIANQEETENRYRNERKSH